MNHLNNATMAHINTNQYLSLLTGKIVNNMRKNLFILKIILKNLLTPTDEYFIIPARISRKQDDGFADLGYLAVP